MSVQADQIVADAKRYAEVLAKFGSDQHAAILREAAIQAYLQGFKSGLTHAVKEACGVPS